MDEVRTDRLSAKHGKDTLLVIIRDWPADEKYKDKPELVASLEYLVCILSYFPFSQGKVDPLILESNPPPTPPSL